jgi:hypothetical protein
MQAKLDEYKEFVPFAKRIEFQANVIFSNNNYYSTI